MSLSSQAKESMRLLAIVPAYNEQDSVATVVEWLKASELVSEILVVDDGSTDDTYRVAAAAGATVVRHPYNLGIGGAVQSGYMYADRHDFDLAVQVDGDGQHDPEELAVLIEAFERRGGTDLVVGSRFLGKEGDRSTAARRVGMKVFTVVLSTLMRTRVTDPTSGFRMTNRNAIALFARDYPHDYPEVEALLMVHAHSMTMAEVPVRMRARAGGQSSITRVGSAYYMVKVLLAIFVGMFRARPVVSPGDEAPVHAVGH